MQKNYLASAWRACIQTMVGFVTIIIIGCSQAIGPSFQPVENLSPERSMVYFYFPIQIGWNDSHTILADRRVVTRLDREGYYPFVTRPGRKIFTVEGWPEADSLKIDVEAGRAYFVRISLVGRGLLTYYRYDQLELVPTDLATREIQSLRLMRSCHTIQGCEGVE